MCARWPITRRDRFIGPAMTTWIQRVTQLFGHRAGPQAARVAGPAPVSTPPAPTSPHLPPEAPAASQALPANDLRLPFFMWLVDARQAPATPATVHEQRLLRHLDRLLASDDACAALLPRAPAVIPQLLNSLRDESQSDQALAKRVEKDATLVAEVIRSAGSVQARGDAPVTDLAHAIRRIGMSGLQRVIARVVLRPIFDAQGDPLSARAAPRLWLHSEAKAQTCAELATDGGIDPFEAYIAGLMHNIGWTAALRAIDRSEGGGPPHFTQAFVQAFEPRRNLLFARLVRPWQLHASLTGLAESLIGGSTLGTAPGTLGPLLSLADQLAAAHVLPLALQPLALQPQIAAAA